LSWAADGGETQVQKLQADRGGMSIEGKGRWDGAVSSPCAC
jgi:hypothetical protein